MLKPWPDHFFPGIAFVARFLLIAGRLHQNLVYRATTGQSDSNLTFASAHYLVAGADQAIYINLPTDHRPESPSSCEARPKRDAWGA